MPEFHGDGLRVYITSYSLPAPPEFDNGGPDQSPREAPPIALPEEIRPEMHEFMADGLMLPAYDSNHTHTAYSKITAKPGEPLQVHFMVWTQQVLHDMDLPENEDEFLDLRIELSCNGQIVDIGYINHASIKPNGIPVGIEFVGQRCGDARETPLFFTVPSNPVEKLRESTLNILVTVGRIGGFSYHDASKAMSKMVRVGPYYGKYESSTLRGGDFNGYVWRKEHQNLIRPDRGVNPRTKLYAWKRKWMQNDVFRLGVVQRAYERRKRDWELEREAEGEAYGEDMGGVETTSLKKGIKRARVNADGTIVSSTTMLLAEAVTGEPLQQSPYSFRRARRNSDANTSTATSNSPVSSSPTNKMQYSPGQQHSSPPSSTSGRKPSYRRSTKGVVLANTVHKGDPQQPSLSNVTFGAFPYKTSREYCREFIPYQDLCRIQYLVENPKIRELRSGTVESSPMSISAGGRGLRSSTRHV
ncbi:hypothetical protein TWF481_001588 [Arthrobotrys musiformis]|uniref:Uncharacterized protein n=1 Tax=Arthrobotrys musiformis TaxID=47236 RepID=A0AAV9VTU1_9PEZI